MGYIPYIKNWAQCESREAKFATTRRLQNFLPEETNVRQQGATLHHAAKHTPTYTTYSLQMTGLCLEYEGKILNI